MSIPKETDLVVIRKHSDGQWILTIQDVHGDTRYLAASSTFEVVFEQLVNWTKGVIVW